MKIGRKRPIPRINVFRPFPLSGENKLISVRDAEDQEIGLIADLDDFPHATRRLIEDELDRRYFTPVIKEIVSLKDEFGYTYWDVITDSGSRRFTVKGRDNSVSLHSPNTLLIADVDGNRFELPEYQVLGSKYMRIIEALF